MPVSIGSWSASELDAAFGAATDAAPKFLSPADPATWWTGADGGLVYFAYSTNYLIDLGHAIIAEEVSYLSVDR